MKQEDMDFYVADGKVRCAKCDGPAYVVSGHHSCCGVLEFCCEDCSAHKVEVRD